MIRWRTKLDQPREEGLATALGIFAHTRRREPPAAERRNPSFGRVGQQVKSNRRPSPFLAWLPRRRTSKPEDTGRAVVLVDL